jgi:hypothetical protein
MTRKEGENLEEAFEHRVKEMQRLFEQRQQEYRDLVESIQKLNPLDKAEAWLKYVANNIDTLGEQEALVYLVSRGYDCSQHIQKTAAMWRLLAKKVIEDHRRTQYIEDLDSGERRVYREELPYAEASDVLNQSPYDLRDFWGGTDYQDLSIDATMLRTVEWCDIGGFEEWWHRLARENYDMVIHGGIEAVPASFFLLTCVDPITQSS